MDHGGILGGNRAGPGGSGIEEHQADGQSCGGPTGGGRRKSITVPPFTHALDRLRDSPVERGNVLRDEATAPNCTG